jgi:hypothetical protein
MDRLITGLSGGLLASGASPQFLNRYGRASGTLHDFQVWALLG